MRVGEYTKGYAYFHICIQNISHTIIGFKWVYHCPIGFRGGYFFVEWTVFLWVKKPNIVGYQCSRI